MISTMRSSTTLRAAVLALVALGATGILEVQSQQAPGGPDRPVFRGHYGLFGLAPGEQVRLTLVNAEPPPDPDLPAPNGSTGVVEFPPDPCDVALFLFDGAGHEVGKLEATLQRNESAALQFTFDELVKGGIVAPDQTGRLPLWAAVSFRHTSRAIRTHLFPPDPCIPTLEILDQATGRVTVLCPPGPPTKVATPPGPPVRQLFGLLGLAPGQTARLNVVAPSGPPIAPPGTSGEVGPGPIQYPPGPPTNVELIFSDAAGAVVLRSEGEVGPGRGLSLDLPASVTSTNGLATQVRATLHVLGVAGTPNPKFPPNPCLATVEIFDSATGRTSVIQLPAVQLPAVQLPAVQLPAVQK